MGIYKKYVTPYLSAFILGPIFMIVEVIGEVLLPKMMSLIINEGIKGGAGSGYIITHGIIMVLLALCMMGGGVLGAYFAVKASVNFAGDLRKDIFAKVQQFSFANIEKFSTGSLVTRLTNDITNLQNVISMALRMLLRAPGMLIGGLIMAIMMNARLAIILGVVIPILIVSLVIVIGKAFPRFNIMQTKIDSLNSRIQENITDTRVVKSFVRDEFEKEMVNIKWDAEAAEKGGFEHFMMKEIHEQPKALKDTINTYVKDGKIDLSSVGISPEEFAQYHRICIVACGSAYHVGIAAKYVMEDLTGLMVDVDFASEFRYRNPKLSQDTLVVIISQSGETADSLAALRLTKEMGVKTLAIVNVVGSSIAREADHVMYTLAGPEIAVATTKAYSTQLICMYILSMYAAQVRGEIEESTLNSMLKEIVLLPEKVASILADKERIQWFANKFASAHDVFFIGRGLDYAICQEGSLKMKEVSYVHSEAYAAGELKHGTISLIEDGTLVIGVLTQSHLCEKTLSNMQEVKSRGAYLMGVAENGSYYLEDMVDFVVYVPKTDPHFTTTLAIIPLQLMGYYVSVARGLDVDKPRNLAKSVTVE